MTSRADSLLAKMGLRSSNSPRQSGWRNRTRFRTYSGPHSVVIRPASILRRCRGGYAPQLRAWCALAFVPSQWRRSGGHALADQCSVRHPLLAPRADDLLLPGWAPSPCRAGGSSCDQCLFQLNAVGQPTIQTDLYHARFAAAGQHAIDARPPSAQSSGDLLLGETTDVVEYQATRVCSCSSASTPALWRLLRLIAMHEPLLVQTVGVSIWHGAIMIVEARG
jgi:hypothetical protein